MKRRSVWLGASLVCASLTGCEPLHHGLRSKPSEPALDSADDKPGEVESAPPKGFFKSSRLPGAWSEEAREVESHLGVH
jgi:hypothetical protein